MSGLNLKKSLHGALGIALLSCVVACTGNKSNDLPDIVNGTPNVPMSAKFPVYGITPGPSFYYVAQRISGIDVKSNASAQAAYDAAIFGLSYTGGTNINGSGVQNLAQFCTETAKQSVAQEAGTPIYGARKIHIDFSTGFTINSGATNLFPVTVQNSFLNDVQSMYGLTLNTPERNALLRAISDFLPPTLANTGAGKQMMAWFVMSMVCISQATYGNSG